MAFSGFPRKFRFPHSALDMNFLLRADDDVVHGKHPHRIDKK